MALRTKVRKLISTTAVFLLFVCAVACSPQPQPSGSEQEDRRTEQIAAPAEWSQDVDCSMCHADESASMKESACVAGYHSVSQGLTCLVCHADVSGLSDAHQDMTGKAPTKLKSTTVDDEICLSCHVESDLAAATAQLATLTDDAGTVVNPHAIPDNDDHAKTTCSDCHSGHNAEPASSAASSFCMGCHHAGVYQCGTCHDE